jgi:phosphoglycolate phosphatase
MKKLAIFDLDGTLLNTIDDLGQAANYALGKCGYPIHNMASYPFMVGNGVKNLLLKAVPEEARTESVITNILKIFKEYYNEHNC